MHPQLCAFDRLVAYVAFIAAVGGVCAYLAGGVAERAALLASQYAGGGSPGAMSRVARREIEVSTVTDYELTAVRHAVIPEAPPVSLSVLASQMDRAEGMDLGTGQRVRRRGRAARVAEARQAPGRSAAEVFGRSFGVLLMASR